MAIKKETLKKFIKLTNLQVVSIEDDSTDNTEVKKLILAESVTAVGSIPTPQGGQMTLNTKTVFVAGDDIEKFLADATEEDDIIKYEGAMKLDVSKPRFRAGANGAMEVSKASNAWLVSTSFAKRGGQLRTDSRAKLNDAISDMFKTAVNQMATSTSVAATELEPVED